MHVATGVGLDGTCGCLVNSNRPVYGARPPDDISAVDRSHGTCIGLYKATEFCRPSIPNAEKPVLLVRKRRELM